jgi:eukaryotic-like serine/threonine-protein kinase
MSFAAATGDFATAERIAENAAAAGVRTHPQSPAELAMEWILISVELGKTAEAGRVAQTFLSQRDAIDPSEGRLCAGDPAIFMLATERRAGLISRDEFDKQRGAWFSGCEVQPGQRRPALWNTGYAGPASAPVDAREAVLAMASFELTAESHRKERLADFLMGKVYWLAGDMKAALPRLEDANRQCDALKRPILHLQNLYRLGAAREALGERQAACDAYQSVLDRWGGAKESVTAKQAARHAKGLGCEMSRGS